MLRVISVFPMTRLVWTVWRGRRQFPSAIKWYGQIAAAINMPPYLGFSGAGELRDLSLLYAVQVAEYFRIEQKASSATRNQPRARPGDS
jgi:hypothetical protein